MVVYAQGNKDWDNRYISWTIDDITDSESRTEPQEEAGSEPAPAADIKQGEYEGSIDKEFFAELAKENPGSIQLIDVRDPGEFETGHISSAVNMTIDQLEDQISSFNDDKPIVFICSTGARSGEAYFLFLDERPDLKNVYYLDATVDYASDGSFTIK
ncbi:MAG: rhodanese-like domain-containing protein [Desulfonatronovibrionaceae bacterium]